MKKIKLAYKQLRPHLLDLNVVLKLSITGAYFAEYSHMEFLRITQNVHGHAYFTSKERKTAIFRNSCFCFRSKIHASIGVHGYLKLTFYFV